MLDDLRELYQEVILDHGKNPRNFGGLAGANRIARGNNPLCGDKLVVFLKVDDAGVIREAALEGKGCAISTASASLMTEMLKGKTAKDAERLFEAFHRLCTEDAPVAADPDLADDLERLQVLSGVRQFPVRVKCATLAWHAMHAAMTGGREATTE